MNERTFLARGTVALALILVGVGREPLALGLYPGLRLATSIVLLVAAPSCPAQLWLGAGYEWNPPCGSRAPCRR